MLLIERHAPVVRLSCPKKFVAVIPDPRAARSLRFSPRTVDGYHPSRKNLTGDARLEFLRNSNGMKMERAGQ